MRGFTPLHHFHFEADEERYDVGEPPRSPASAADSVVSSNFLMTDN